MIGWYKRGSIAAISRDLFIELTNYTWELHPSSTRLALELVRVNLRASYYIFSLCLPDTGGSGPVQLITWISIARLQQAPYVLYYKGVSGRKFGVTACGLLKASSIHTCKPVHSINQFSNLHICIKISLNFPNRYHTCWLMVFTVCDSIGLKPGFYYLSYDCTHAAASTGKHRGFTMK